MVYRVYPKNEVQDDSVSKENVLESLLSIEENNEYPIEDQIKYWNQKHKKFCLCTSTHFRNKSDAFKLTLKKIVW